MTFGDALRSRLYGKKVKKEEQSSALVADGKYGGCIVSAKSGCVLEVQLSEVGSSRLDDYGLDDAPHGISIWEGYSLWIPGGYEYPQDGELDFRGEFRKLTPDELTKLANGEPLWPALPEDDDEGQREEF